MAQYRKRRRRNPLRTMIPVLSLILAALILVAVFLPQGEQTPPVQTEPIILQSTGPSDEASQPSDQPSAPTDTTPPASSVPESAAPVVKLSTAKISATGDVLMHLPVINKYLIDGSYNFDGIFQHLQTYVQQADYAAGNLETTLAGLNNGYKYSGYPNFNCPDYIIDSMKNAGFDLVLTANNHSYDTRHVGFLRTSQTIADRNLDYLGTKQNAEQPNFIIRQLNGISVGMMCYTYEAYDPTKEKPTDGRIALNCIPLTLEDSQRVNSFDYEKLPAFYAEMADNLTQLKSQGAEATVLFIHWGDEYALTPNATQKAMAQKLCDLGIDVIIGGHPHVVQPVELLTSTTDPAKKTVCLYSMGNAVSNQLKGNVNNTANAKGYTEDGVLFSVTFAKYSDGTVILESVDLLPTWVNRQYHIMPLDKNQDWKTKFGATDSEVTQMNASYDRTTAIVGEGMATVKAYLVQHVQEVENRLNVKK